jgi:hypothetical protein
VYHKKETTMRTGYVSFAIVTLVLTASLPAAADESGHWRGLAALVVTDQLAAKVDDGTNHVASISEQDGAIHNADGKSFLDKARYQVVSVVDTGVIRGGYKTFTEADGSKVFAKYSVTEFKLPEVNGTFEFTGGTGKYTGITGNGTFHYVRVSDKAAWDELVGDYKIPTTAAGTASK